MPSGHDRLIVDGLNVLGSRPDGWWRDRTTAFNRLIHDLQPLAAGRAGAVVVVVEGRAGDQVPEGRHGDVEVVHATRRGPDAADDRIVALVTAARSDAVGGDASPQHGRDVVVTADRALIDRVGGLGAHVLGPSRLLRLLRPEA